MKIYDQYDHLNAFKLIQDKDMYPELSSIISKKDLFFGATSPSDIKRIIGNSFGDNGWADNVKVANSKLTINFLKSGVGTCFQIGNVARTYADILKLMMLHHRGVIEIGVIIVPGEEESKILGKNYARFDRLKREIVLYKDIITVPILAIGLSNS